jgi:hypothetical protein
MIITTEIKETKNKGRGVFAKRPFYKGEKIEACPVIILDRSDRTIINITILRNYTFQWNEDDIAIALGYGSIYNHSYSPNSKYSNDLKNKTIIFEAIKDIKADEEITINYNGEPDSKDLVNFSMAD